MLSIQEPSSYHQAKNETKWVETMDKELHALESNATWDLISLPVNVKPIGCKWVYKVKFNSNGSVERCKARLVARGDKQVKGKDFKHISSPVARFTTIRTSFNLIALASGELEQVDINNAFLHGYIDEDIYMWPPPRYSKAKEGQVCKLKRPLYGLRQASRQWSHELKKFLLHHWGFKQSIFDSSMSVKRFDGEIIIIVAYVDDLLLAGSSKSLISDVKSSLH